jgi:hypothetical protein
MVFFKKEFIEMGGKRMLYLILLRMQNKLKSSWALPRAGWRYLRGIQTRKIEQKCMEKRLLCSSRQFRLAVWKLFFQKSPNY